MNSEITARICKTRLRPSTNKRPQVFLRVLIRGEAYAHALFAQPVFDLRGDLAGKFGAVGGDPHQQPVKFPCRDIEAFQALRIRKENGVARQTAAARQNCAGFCR